MWKKNGSLLDWSQELASIVLLILGFILFMCLHVFLHRGFIPCFINIVVTLLFIKTTKLWEIISRLVFKMTVHNGLLFQLIEVYKAPYLLSIMNFCVWGFMWYSQFVSFRVFILQYLILSCCEHKSILNAILENFWNLFRF